MVTDLLYFSEESVGTLDLPLTQLSEGHLLEVDLKKRKDRCVLCVRFFTKKTSVHQSGILRMIKQLLVAVSAQGINLKTSIYCVALYFLFELFLKTLYIEYIGPVV